MEETMISDFGLLLEINETKYGVSAAITNEGKTDDILLSKEDFITSFVTFFFVFNKSQRAWLVKQIIDNHTTGRIPVGKFKELCRVALIKSLNKKEG